MMTLSEQQKALIAQILQTNIRKTRWVLDNKQLVEEKKALLSRQKSVKWRRSYRFYSLKVRRQSLKKIDFLSRKVVFLDKQAGV